MESANKMQFPLTICGFHLKLRVPQQLNFTIAVFYHFLWIPSLLITVRSSINIDDEKQFHSLIYPFGTIFRYPQNNFFFVDARPRLFAKALLEPLYTIFRGLYGSLIPDGKRIICSRLKGLKKFLDFFVLR